MPDSKRQHGINRQIVGETALYLPLHICLNVFVYFLFYCKQQHKLISPSLSNDTLKWVRLQWERDLELIYENHPLENILQKIVPKKSQGNQCFTSGLVFTPININEGPLHARSSARSREHTLWFCSLPVVDVVFGLQKLDMYKRVNNIFLMQL